MDAEEVKSFSAMAVETSKTDESIGQFFNEAVRDPAIIFHHASGCFAQPGFYCNCSFAKMNFNEMSALNAASQSQLDGLDTSPTLRIRLSERENQVLSNIASFNGIFTAAKAGSIPKASGGPAE